MARRNNIQVYHWEEYPLHHFTWVTEKNSFFGFYQYFLQGTSTNCLWSQDRIYTLSAHYHNHSSSLKHSFPFLQPKAKAHTTYASPFLQIHPWLHRLSYPQQSCYPLHTHSSALPSLSLQLSLSHLVSFPLSFAFVNHGISGRGEPQLAAFLRGAVSLVGSPCVPKFIIQTLPVKQQIKHYQEASLTADFI